METPTTRGQITNPYTQENRAQYKMGSIETFLHDKLGFRTGIDKYNEQMDNAANEWETQNQSLAYEEMYNSPEAQAQRMRQAGLNPDINASSIDPGTAGEMTEPETVPESPEGQDLEAMEKAGDAAASLGMFLIDMAAGGIGIGTALQGLKNLKLEGENTEIAGSEELFKAVQKAHETYGNLDKSGDGLTYANGLYIGKAMGYSGRRLGEFSRMYDDIYNSVPTILKNKDNINALTRSNWTAENIETILGAEKLSYEAAAQKALVESKRNKQIADVLTEYPEFTKEMMLSGKIEAMANAAAAGDNAKITHYTERAEKAVQEVRRINAEADKELAEQDNEIITKFYEEQKPTWKDALFPGYGLIRRKILRRQYERASRRKYGRNNDVKDNLEKFRIKGKL